MASYKTLEATLVGSPGDGVAPSFLLSLKPDKAYLTPQQYLFNAPAGFSRLALEHRVRPSLGLKAIFATGVGCHAMGGLGGLILRLRQDGHGHVQLLGPLGTRSVVEGLTEFVKWQSPEVQVTELQPATAAAAPAAAARDCVGGNLGGERPSEGGGASPSGSAYEDDHIQVCCLWSASVLWAPPAWLLPTQSRLTLQAALDAQELRHPQPSTHPKVKAGSSSSDSDTSSGDSSREGDAVMTEALDDRTVSAAHVSVLLNALSPGGEGVEGVDEPVVTEPGSSQAMPGAEADNLLSNSTSSDSDEASSSSSSSSDTSSSNSSGEEQAKAASAGGTVGAVVRGLPAPPLADSVFSRLDALFAGRAGGSGGAGGSGRGAGGARGGAASGSAGGVFCGRGRGRQGGLSTAAASGRGGQLAGRGSGGRGAAAHGLRSEVLLALRQGGAAGQGMEDATGTATTAAAAAAGPGGRPGQRTHTLASMNAATSRGTQPLVAGGPQAAAGGATPANATQPRQVLGYLCHLRSSGKLLLLMNCPHLMLLEGLEAHPALAVLRAGANASRLIATLHLTPHHVASTPKYRSWMRRLPGQQVWAGLPSPVAPPSTAAPTPVPAAEASMTSLDAMRDLVPLAAEATGQAAQPEATAAAQVAPEAETTSAAATNPDPDLGIETRTNPKASSLHPAACSQPKSEQVGATAAGSLRGGAAVTNGLLPIDGKGPAPVGGGNSLQSAACERPAPGGGDTRIRSATASSSAGLKGLPIRPREANSMGFRSAARTAIRLNMVSPVLFPLPYVLRPRQMACPVAYQPDQPRATPASAVAAAISRKRKKAPATVNSGREGQQPQRPSQRVGGGGVPRASSAKVVEAGLLWKLRVQLTEVAAAAVTAGMPTDTMAAGGGGGCYAALDTALVPDCVDVDTVQQDVLLAKGEELSVMIKELHEAAPGLLSDAFKSFLAAAANGSRWAASTGPSLKVDGLAGQPQLQPPQHLSQSRGPTAAMGAAGPLRPDALKSFANASAVGRVSGSVRPPPCPPPPPSGWLAASAHSFLNQEGLQQQQQQPQVDINRQAAKKLKATLGNRIDLSRDTPDAAAVTATFAAPVPAKRETGSAPARAPEPDAMGTASAAVTPASSSATRTGGTPTRAGATAAGPPSQQATAATTTATRTAVTPAATTGSVITCDSAMAVSVPAMAVAHDAAAGVPAESMDVKPWPAAPTSASIGLNPPNGAAGMPSGASSKPSIGVAAAVLLDEDPVPSCLLTAEAAATAVMFLGTGSAEPSKYRGPSAILLLLPEETFMMVDCGEGTWGQLVRSFGPNRAVEVVAGLQCVWLSHKHADHVLGLEQLLSNRPPSCRPLLVVGPGEVGRWLERARALHPSWRVTFLPCGRFDGRVAGPAGLPSAPRYPGSPPADPAAWMAGGLGMTAWCSVPVHHCRDAWGLILEHRSGWKLVYSGDTRPCRRLEQLGRGATLLIHEATFEPGLFQMAATKRHSTSQEALDVSKGMQAYRTVLTHFSQRYPRVPEGLDSLAMPLRNRPAIAFDGMLVPLGLLPVLPLAVPLLAHVLSKEAEEEPQQLQ